MNNIDAEQTEAYHRENNICPSCGGFGDHGCDEDGLLYVCYACSGTGLYTVPTISSKTFFTKEHSL